MKKLKIVVEKVRGVKQEKFYKIKEFDGLGLDDLPKKYLSGLPYCHVLIADKNDRRLLIYDENKHCIPVFVGNFYFVDQFEEIWKTIMACGERLHKINKEWEGVEVFET